MKFLSHVRTAWLMVGVTCLLLLVGEFAARTYARLRQGDAVDPRIHAEVFRDADWRTEYFDEFVESNHAEWTPYVYFKRAPFSGVYINVDDAGRRMTVNETASDPQFEVFMLGGSTLWGTGARDAGTIPSLVSQYLTASRVRVTNLGETGYVSTQEVIRLMLELKAGARPTHVVFYTGVNDVFSAFQSGVAGIPQNEMNRRDEFNLRERFGLRDLVLRDSEFVGKLAGSMARGMNADADPPTPSPEGLADAVVLNFLANVGIIEALAAHYDFEPVFVWQPSLYSKDPLSSAEEVILAKPSHAKMKPLYERVYAAVASLDPKPSGFHDLQDVFDGTDNTIFFDFCHVGEPGNAAVARAIADILASDFGR